MNLNNLTQLASTAIEASTDMAKLPFVERAAYGFEVMLIGMGIVFAVLLLLILILQVFQFFGKGKNTEVKQDAPAVSATSAPATPAAAPVATVPASEEAIVAIATAAIAASRGESECAFNVISIKKIVK